ncbi:uncharacterized protein CC84DRAFT_1208348 [Paraphaeosphaeria sporulosa]|uniref:Mid2 domain-containing protein n=1 Tax=Paraphaeosphaeria sporulosa TaxID=1460663 RepID=A0A177C3H9_9PLEO|nr:uncharacterized protein CC84DRAFT_1208348 [Paraphaeosphaeria sporulosa]OAG02294.1 hypothetical protein CC84DRAFT_1208348 [Paraphaeosphaeria sporulosa]
MKVTTKAVLYLAHFLPVVSSTCYMPNGNTTNDAACNGGADTGSACCGPGYACLSNTLCALTEHVSSDIVKTSPFYVRGGCTDKNWASKDCPKFCRNATNGDNLGIGGMGIGRCDGEGQTNRFYCRNSETAGLSNTDLCSNKQYYFEFSGFPTTVTVIGQEASGTPDATSSTSTSETTTSSTSSSFSTSSPAVTQPSDKEKRVGLGLGIGLGVPLLAAIGFLAFVFMSRWRTGGYSRSKHDATQSPAPSSHGVHSWSPQWSKHAAAGELGTEAQVSEVPASHQAYELQNSYIADPGTLTKGQKNGLI